eukprot:IDg21160t1
MMPRKLILSKSWWKNDVFFDEKKFHLGGADGLHYYWVDKKVDQRTASQQKFVGESVMVWDAFHIAELVPSLNLPQL